MSKWLASLFIVGLVFMTMRTSFPASLPQFSDYPVPKTYAGRSVRPILATPEARQFRTMLKMAASGKANFAGRYILAQWGCGTECIMGAVIDATSGKVSFFPFGDVCCWGTTELGIPKEDFEPIHFRLNSRLIVFLGQLHDEGKVAAHYYSFDSGKFSLLNSIPINETEWAGTFERVPRQ